MYVFRYANVINISLSCFWLEVRNGGWKEQYISSKLTIYHIKDSLSLSYFFHSNFIYSLQNSPIFSCLNAVGQQHTPKCTASFFSVLFVSQKFYSFTVVDVIILIPYHIHTSCKCIKSMLIVLNTTVYIHIVLCMISILKNNTIHIYM